jgi:hypothetical protein
MEPLTGPQIDELVDILCEAFTPEENLVRLVRVALDVDLFTEFAGPRQPLRNVAFELVTRLEGRFLTSALLAGALRLAPGSARLTAFCQRVAPDLLAEPVPAVNAVAAVVEGIRSLRQRLQDPAIRAIVVASRDDLSNVDEKIERLEIYKSLHDALHHVQVQYYRGVVDTSRKLASDPTAPYTLDEYVTGIETLTVQARTAAVQLKKDEDRAEEQRWIKNMDGDVIAPLRVAIRTRADMPARTGAVRLKLLLNLESARINRLLVETARSLPLHRLITTLAAVEAPGGDASLAVIRNGLASLRMLYPRLIGQIARHTQWQRVEIELWQADDALHQSGSDGPTEFAILWPAIRLDVDTQIGLDSGADWARDLTDLGNGVNTGLAASDLTSTRLAFRSYRRRAMLRFFQVDSILRELCADLAGIREPVAELLREANP